MTDLEKFIDLYKSFGIDLEQKVDGESIIVTIDANSHPTKTDGFIGPFTEVKFSLSGEFIGQDFWE